MEKISYENQNLIVSSIGLLTIDIVLLGALFAQVDPHPPGYLGPFIGAMVTMGVITVILVLWDREAGQITAVVYGCLNLLAVGPQKLVLDPNGMAVVPIIILGTTLIGVLFYSILSIRKEGVAPSSLIIKKGSIYYALRELKKDGAIDEVERTRDGRYPDKTIFQVTAKGRELFDSLQEEAFLGLFPHFYGFKIALKFNTRRTAEEIEGYAERAIQRIDQQFEAMDEYLSGLDENSTLYKTDSFFIKHEKMLFGAEKEWIQDAVRNLSMLQGG
jgi:DNA-binding PadR family transcriptional regulator